VVVDLLGGLSVAQAEAVRSDAAPLAVVAGPGAGKTRVLTRRVAWRCRQDGVDPAHVLVLTFSRRAASELLARLGRLGLPAGARHHGVVAGTFHAVAWAELSRYRAERGQSPPAVISRPARLLRPALTDVLGRQPEGFEVAALVGDIGWARAQLATAEGYAALARTNDRRSVLAPQVVAEAWEAYATAKRRRAVIDLDDLLDAARHQLTDDAVAAAARWRHRHVFVDEYQDLNPTHRALLTAWVGGRTDLFIVGDPDQAVYGFNGSSPDLFGRVRTDWPGIEVLELRANFRSSPEIIALAEAARPVSGPAVSGPAVSGPAVSGPAVSGPAVSGPAVSGPAVSGPAVTGPAVSGPAAPTSAGEAPSRAAAASPGPGSSRPPGPLPTLTGHADPDAEAAAVAEAIRQRGGPGHPWAGMAVLARTNARLAVVAAALTQAGVPWRLRDPRPLSERPGVRAWLDGLPGSAPASDLGEDLDTLVGPGERELAAGALDEYLRVGGHPTVRGFSAWLDANGVTSAETATAAVDLVTFHRAKGLEWRSVWIVGVEEGHVPLASVTDEAGLAEERRLLYVAVTRAEDELGVSWATSYERPDGRSVPRQPSRWVAALEHARQTLGAEPQALEQRARLAAMRHALPDRHEESAAAPDGRGAERARRRALTAWRATRARAARVPESVIMPDALLASLARSGPTDPDEVVRLAGRTGRRLAHWAPEVAAILGGAELVA